MIYGRIQHGTMAKTTMVLDSFLPVIYCNFTGDKVLISAWWGFLSSELLTLDLSVAI